MLVAVTFYNVLNQLQKIESNKETLRAMYSLRFASLFGGFASHIVEVLCGLLLNSFLLPPIPETSTVLNLHAFILCVRMHLSTIYAIVL